jgi:hypothetical protein
MLEPPTERMAESLRVISEHLSEKHMLEPPTEKHIQERANILSNLHNEPASPDLQAYYKSLKEGSPTCTIDAFIEGGKSFVNRCGSEKLLKGLLYPSAFVEQWNQQNPERPITVWDDEIRYQCPPSWSNEVIKGVWVLRYLGEDLFGQGFNELLKGPTTIACGMWIQLFLWMALRWAKGDKTLGQKFKFKKGEFTLTQYWDQPMNDAGTKGNLLYSFYDLPLGDTTNSRIRSKTIFNHPKYRATHPGGVAYKHNIIQCDNEYMIFDPATPPNMVSHSDLEKRFLQEYNVPRDVADWETLWRYIKFPEYIHPRLTPKNFGTLAREAEEYADHTLSETEWNDCKRSKGAHLVFNFERLISCLDEYKDGEDILVNARTRQELEWEAARMKPLLELEAKITQMEERLKVVVPRATGD